MTTWCPGEKRNQDGFLELKSTAFLIMSDVLSAKAQIQTPEKIYLCVGFRGIEIKKTTRQDCRESEREMISSHLRKSVIS